MSDLVRSRPGLALGLSGYFALRTAQVRSELACGIQHGIVPRLANTLVRAFELTGSSALALTQEELAVFLRAQRTTISEAAGQLKAQGAISHLRGMVRLLDDGRLRAISCGCGDALPI